MRILTRSTIIFFLLFVTNQFEIYAIDKSVINQDIALEKAVASIPEAKITLYATEKDGALQRDLTNFKLRWMGHDHIFPRWVNVINPAYYPELYYSDINNDGEKEIIIVLTTGYGSEDLIQEVHVLQIRDDGSLLEILVDNPIAILNKNVKTKISNTEASITINNKTTILNFKKLEIEPSHIFENASIGRILKFNVVNNKLMAIAGVTIAPSGGELGEIHIIYNFRDNMYQAEQISFIPRKEIE